MSVGQSVGQIATRTMPNHLQAIEQAFNAVSNGLERADLKATYDEPQKDERCARFLIMVRVSAYKVDGAGTIRIDVAATDGYIFG